ncbi:MAG TPA: MGMT family protein [Candidatus Norongarragalinales archaeon]|jgi:O-6-methylguanine DNA methyltransferase|nr:MGMT family protein [Candidatus Norongarragalinales archaeon]
MATELQQKVWKALYKIPRGRVSTYKAIARVVGRPKAVRAIGQALKKNPNAPACPCHRVVASDGSLGGYNGAMNSRKKIALLEKEGVQVHGGRVVDFDKVFFRF